FARRSDARRGLAGGSEATAGIAEAAEPRGGTGLGVPRTSRSSRWPRHVGGDEHAHPHAHAAIRKEATHLVPAFEAMRAGAGGRFRCCGPRAAGVVTLKAGGRWPSAPLSGNRYEAERASRP